MKETANIDAWNSLPMAERAAMIKVAVGNGITNLQDIRDRYNEFAWGGPSEAAKKRIERWEGKAMTGAKDPLSGKYARNSSFEDEAKRFYSVLPKNIREQVLSNPELADNLYSYSYNVGAGNFKKRVVPALQRYYAGKGSVEDIQRSMWASGDTKLRGLQRRRAVERAGVGRALLGGDTPIPTFYTETTSTGNESFIPFKPMIPDVFGAEQPIEAPVTIENIPPTIQKPEEPVYSPEEIERQEKVESLANLSRIFSLMNGASENSGVLGALNLLTGNYANGGKIHIKPSHRGRLTELKERTGKTEAELYNDGNPAHKKMVVFARNSRKWKHGLGGNLYPDGGYVREVNGHPIAFDYEGNLIDQVTGEKGYMPLPEISVIANPDDVAMGRAQRWYRDFGIESNDATSVADGRRQNIHLDERGIEGIAKAAAWAKDHPVLNNVGLGLSTIPFAVAAAPAVVGGGELAATALANPYVDAALTSMGGAHAAQSLANGEANWMTALELAPLGRLARPLYEGVVQPGMRLFNSPLTGNWTKIGNREYRLNPNSLGANGSPIESRGIEPQITVENAANITPEQWTAAQDAAIARGDMAEAQRLRDLHFQVSAPNTKTDVPLWSSSEEAFNSFDLSHFGETDSGFFGYGHYLTPIEKYAATYHPVNRKFYANIENPYIGSNDQYFNRIQYVKDRLARRKENVMHNLRDGKLTKFSKKLGINENTSLEDAERLVDKYIVDETVKWNDKYVKYADEFEGKDGVLSWRELQGIPNKQEGIYREVVVPRGEQIKSADVVTYDDNGIRIPLGLRDNFKINDIRYGLLPFLGLGTAATLYGRSNK